MKTIAFFCGIIFAGLGAWMLASKLSDEAVMTLTGILCGAVASIPAAILLWFALTRERVPENHAYTHRAEYPVGREDAPTIIITRPTPQALRTASEPKRLNAPK